MSVPFIRPRSSYSGGWPRSYLEHRSQLVPEYSDIHIKPDDSVNLTANSDTKDVHKAIYRYRYVKTSDAARDEADEVAYITEQRMAEKRDRLREFQRQVKRRVRQQKQQEQQLEETRRAQLSSKISQVLQHSEQCIVSQSRRWSNRRRRNVSSSSPLEQQSLRIHNDVALARRTLASSRITPVVVTTNTEEALSGSKDENSRKKKCQVRNLPSWERGLSEGVHMSDKQQKQLCSALRKLEMKQERTIQKKRRAIANSTSMSAAKNRNNNIGNNDSVDASPPTIVDRIQLVRKELHRLLRLRGVNRKDVPCFCACGRSAYDNSLKKCATNCVFHKNPTAYLHALMSLLSQERQKVEE